MSSKLAFTRITLPTEVYQEDCHVNRSGSTLKKYQDLLVRNNIPPHLHGFFKKWLRYYLDFCRKYQYFYSDTETLPLFLYQLSEKKQSSEQQSQARLAIQLYYTGLSSQTPLTESIQKVTEPEKSYQPVKRQSTWEAALQALHDEIKLRHYSPKTYQSYSLWAKKLRYFSNDKPPEQLTPAVVKDFLTSLAVEKKVSASSQNQAFNALLFFFRHVLNKEFGKIDGVVRARKKPHIPVVLSRSEIAKIMENLSDPCNLGVQLLYGCGLRLSECLNLRINHFNFDAGMLTIHNGKGDKDRTVPLPESIAPELGRQIEKTIALHRKDLESGNAGAFMPGILEEKYKNAGQELPWQFQLQHFLGPKTTRPYKAVSLTTMPGGSAKDERNGDPRLRLRMSRFIRFVFPVPS